MNTKQFSEALGELDDKYIEKAISYRAKKSSAPYVKRGLLPLAAAITALLLLGSAVAAVVLYGDLWFQKPSDDPLESVRSALENQVGKDYTIKIEVKSVEIDEEETARTVERFLNGPIADRYHWSDAYLAGHFLAVKAVYHAEYDHTKTTRSDGEVTMYFYLTQDADSGAWTIVDNSGNVNRPEGGSAGGSGSPAARSTEEQLFSYLSELFNQAYSPYYDGLHYEMSAYEETSDGGTVTATFLWTMHFLGKRWDIAADEGVEQEANWYLQATATADGDGVLDFDTISILADGDVTGAARYNIPIEEYFPA